VKPVDEHVAECLSAVGVLPAVDLPLLEALDCVLAQDVVSALDLPRFDNSAMDGYAVRIIDVASTSQQRPTVLTVSADLPAGVAEVSPLVPATTARIMTGAPVPIGTDAVVPVEWTDRGVQRVTIRQCPTPGQYVRRAGEDVRAGESVLRAGTRLSPRHIALLAAVGRATARVHPRPRVVVLSTGNELVAPGAALGFGQIHDANGYGLVAAALELGALARHGGVVPDREEEVTAALESALLGADVLITSGGVSAGAYDTVKEVLRRSGTVLFERVAMQPGMPQGFGTIGPSGIPIFTLPGNPVSSMVSFELFVRPVLRKLSGEVSLHRHVVPAVAALPWTSPRGKRQFVRAVLDRRRDGLSVVTPAGGQGSHLVADLAGATCLAIVPEEVDEVTVGMTLNCMLLDRVRR
jgi:molybdopterin molybdotransferase